MVILLIDDIALENLHRLQVGQDLEQKLMSCLFKQVNLLNNFSMRALDNLISQLLWQIYENLLLLDESILRLVVCLQESFDLGKHGYGHALGDSVLFENDHLVIELLLLSIQCLYVASHGADGIRVESDAYHHPCNSEHSFLDGLDSDVAKAYSR